MLDKANFWEQYRKWKMDCYQELLDKGYKPEDWENIGMRINLFRKQPVYKC